MNIQVRWWNEKQNAILWIFEELWTFEDCDEALQITSEMTEDVPSFDLVIDLSKVNIMPRNFVFEIRSRENCLPYNHGIAIAFGISPFLRPVIALIGKLPNIRGQLVIANSFDHVTAIIEERHNSFSGLDIETRDFSRSYNPPDEDDDESIAGAF